MLGLYLHAGLSKLGVSEWVDGTAIFYWFRSVIFGAPPLLRPLLDAITDVPLLVALVTWGSVAIEIALGVALFLPRREQAALLVSGLLFHDGIAICMGLWSFDTAMTAALILYLTAPGAQLAAPRDWPLITRLRRLPKDGAQESRRTVPAHVGVPATQRTAAELVDPVRNGRGGSGRPPAGPMINEARE